MSVNVSVISALYLKLNESNQINISELGILENELPGGTLVLTPQNSIFTGCIIYRNQNVITRIAFGGIE